MFLILSYWMSEILLEMFVSIYNMYASMLLPNMLPTPIFSRSYSNYAIREYTCFSCSIISEENLVVVSLKTLVLSEMLISPNLRLTSFSCCLSKWSIMYWIEWPRISLLKTVEGMKWMVVDSIEGENLSLDLDRVFVERGIMRNKFYGLVGFELIPGHCWTLLWLVDNVLVRGL